MILTRVRRITTNSDFSYENASVYRDEDGDGVDCKDLITNPDLDIVVIKTKDGEKKVIIDWSCGIIELKKMREPLEGSVKIKQLVLSGELSFSPAYIIRIDDYDRFNIPRVFTYQLSFIADRILYVTRQQNMLEMTVQ